MTMYNATNQDSSIRFIYWLWIFS